MPLMLAADGEPPLFLAGFLKQRQREYYERLAAAQLKGEWLPWVDFFAQGICAAAREAIEIADGLTALVDRWREELSDLRSDAAARRLLPVLTGLPVITTRLAAERLGVSFPAANNAIARLVERGVLVEGPRRGHSQTFLATEALAMLER